MFLQDLVFELSYTKTHYLLIIGTALIIVGFIFRQIIPVYVIFMVSAIFISGVALCFGPKHKDTGESHGKNNFFIMVIASSLYAVIAGLAIKTVFDNLFTKKIMVDIGVPLNQTLEHTSNASFHTLLIAIQNSQYDILMMFSFILTAVPFYHGAMIFLSEKSKFDPKHPNTLFYNFGFLFLQSIILLCLALSLESFLLSIVLFILLMIISSLWVIIIRKKAADTHPPPLGWLCLNLGFSAALFLITYDGWTPQISSIYLVVICIIRTAVDYKLFKKMYVGHSQVKN